MRLITLLDGNSILVQIEFIKIPKIRQGLDEEEGVRCCYRFLSVQDQIKSTERKVLRFVEL